MNEGPKKYFIAKMVGVVETAITVVTANDVSKFHSIKDGAQSTKPVTAKQVRHDIKHKWTKKQGNIIFVNDCLTRVCAVINVRLGKRENFYNVLTLGDKILVFIRDNEEIVFKYL